MEVNLVHEARTLVNHMVVLQHEMQLIFLIYICA